MKINLNEVTRKDILSDVDPRTLANSKAVKGAEYRGITPDYVVVFDVKSVTANPSTTYQCKIKLLDYDFIDTDTELNTQGKIRLAITGDLNVSCTCPAYKWWGYEYIMTELDGKEGSPQSIYPKVRNPELEGTVCKHLKLAVQVLVFNWSKMVKDISIKNFI